MSTSLIIMGKVVAKVTPSADKAVKPAKVLTILDTWGKSDDAKKSENLQMNFKMLESKGNQDIIEKSIKVNDARKDLETAKQSALKDPNFNKIASAALKLEATELELNRAKQTFVSLFGCSPSV